MKKFVREYAVELIALLVALLGLALMFGPFDTPAGLSRLGDAAHFVEGVAQRILESTRAFAQRFSAADLLGLILAVAGGAFVLWRVRVRLQRTFRWIADACPVCGTHLRRAHRTLSDRLVRFVLLPHARRYRCSNPNCGWSGLRVNGPHHPGAQPMDEQAASPSEMPES